MSWRYCLKDFLKSSYLTDIYEFGVYTGQSLLDIHKVLLDNKIKFNRIFGFDSFEGMPEEKEEPISQECWKSGEFDARKLFSVNSVAECLTRTYNILEDKGLTSPPLQLIPGFYEKILNEDLARQYEMKPALYVDIDCDLYSSAKTTLNFMFSNKLIKIGSIIAFDDWGGIKQPWLYQSGQPRAFKEICETYNIECHLLLQIGNAFPHIHTIFRVISM